MDIAQIYDQFVADHFDEDYFQIYQDARDQALSQLRERGRKTPATILDLGMGTGEWLLKLAEAFPQAACHGVELSQKMIEVAQRKFAERGRSVRVFHEDANHFGRHIGRATMELITVHFVLNYIDRKRVIAEAFRCMKPSGLFSVASSTHESFAALQELGKQFLPAEVIKAQFLIPEDLQELENDLREAGFAVAEGRVFRKPVRFEDFDHFYHFAMHSGWLADPIFLKHMSQEQLGMYRDITKPIFPFDDCFQAAIVLAEKPA
ncbi:MAG: class I SAM-dependent methyltransferase [bacterium]